ncbi:MAG: type IV pilus modification protein PilV [Gammaproteobacteria bacterium]|nr:type IV pilus modification protein PilV [Gammaproteobacteria bacterium]
MSHTVNPFRSTTHSRRDHSGFTLIEVLVTVVVVSIGLLGLAGLQINGLRANLSSEARSKATLLASDIIERMRANPLGVANNDYANINTAGIGCGAAPDPFCSNNSGGIALVTAPEGCTPTEMASFDAWIWACGLPQANADVLRGGVTNQLNQGTGNVACNDGDTTDADPCSAGSTYTVNVSWNELNPNSTDPATSGANTQQNISLVVVP